MASIQAALRSKSPDFPGHKFLAADPFGPRINRLALVTDAWRPQTNGVVNTLVRLVKHLELEGMEVMVVAPDAHFTLPLPSYPEIRVACDPWKAIGRIRGFAPDAVHVATEGPLGFSTVAWLRFKGLRFSTSFHTRYPEYLSARVPVVPVSWGYDLVRWFHGRAEHTLVSSLSLLQELREKRVGRHLIHWPRGVDADVFHPSHRRDDVYAGLPGPIWLYIGRVAVEKSLEDFLKLPLPGTKVVVGDGPSREDLQRNFPDVVWRGYQFGAELSAHFASADCFVFPSRTETFGNVILEALASGLPVASVPAPGPVDLVVEGVNGAIDDDLHHACQRALSSSRERARASVVRRTLRAGHDLFRAHLVPLRPEIPFAIPRPAEAA
jgi:glycosyltransferase involved in cell wall biosynthesis